MLPLKKENFNIYLLPDEIAHGKRFPPQRFSDRDDRLVILDSLYEGDFYSFVTDREMVELAISLPRRLVTVQSDLLMMSPLETEYPLRHVAASAIRDMLAYGGAVLLAQITNEGPSIVTVDPPSWYPLDGGGAAFVQPYVSTSAQSSRPDKVEVTLVQDGQVIEEHYGWNSMGGIVGQFGPMESSEVIGEGDVILSVRSPENGIWGESIYLDLTSPLLELAKRFTQNSEILDENADPLVVWSMSDADAFSTFPLPPGVENTITNKDKEVSKGLTAKRAQGNVQLNDSTQKVAYLEFSGNLPASFQQIALSRELVSVLSGLPAVLDGLSQPPPSGVSLRLQYLPFYASTSALQRDLAQDLAIALETIGMNGQFEWPHIFELLDADTQSMVEEAEEDGAA